MTTPEPTPTSTDAPSTSTSEASTTTTTPRPTTTIPPHSTLPVGPDPNRPDGGVQAALYDALANEDAVIFGYGIVSAHSLPEINPLVSEALLTHRGRREAAVSLASRNGWTTPLPAVGYQLPFAVNTPPDAETLAVRMEEDSVVAWRAVAEAAESEELRGVAVPAMTESGVLAARWRVELRISPPTPAFPGGNE
ncbi:ferritin-like domain-containing protein [Mycolicibacterium brumae]|uniref:DUF4439 domain-containing protein n=1 Tax=Mycolicibacterium brumae TaxID=85968 RepID=A0A2G5P6K9_9MYCO|nr:ferritin-like domain-containing protein [Mycolicibacterium brumae]MCV7191555.1 ferritin-like domain-containing protein [Mycolicibacterium brumae]PIB73653.1 DUF4439 domain-containing protein [Mycolicibacterium brumae]RWA16270.1 hypothetical protein MBRU_09175 [Mycolicibacterium brumae DSM 44177]UWW09336.1 ferritin-like domain-containing protein [Mycolicibacterium brumae]